jgi:hypothetical protein
MFTYTVIKVKPNQITVEFPDESWAEVPVYEGETQEVIDARVAEYYHPATEGFESAQDVPFVVGLTYTTEEVSHKPEPLPEPETDYLEEYEEEVLTYKELRAAEYPKVGDQCYAMYLARQGDPTELAEIDAKIAEVDATYPEDMEPITRAEYDELLREAAEEGSVL